MAYCSICTTSLTSPPPSNPSSSHPQAPESSSSSSSDASPPPQHVDRKVPCCGRLICAKCIQKNTRFATYCPYCQVSNTLSPLLPQGLKDPPLYSYLPNSRTRTLAPTSSSSSSTTPPPPYTRKSEGEAPPDEKQLEEDALHFLDHEHDTIHSLSLRYHVPADALRRRNGITSDHLLLGRKAIQIPAEHYRGASLSATPVEGEDEEIRRGKIRRFMTTCKVADYDVALFYLEQGGYHLEGAVEAYLDDEAWEREHPRHKGAERQRSQKRSWFQRVRQ